MSPILALILGFLSGFLFCVGIIVLLSYYTDKNRDENYWDDY